MSRRKKILPEKVAATQENLQRILRKLKNKFQNLYLGKRRDFFCRNEKTLRSL